MKEDGTAAVIKAEKIVQNEDMAEKEMQMAEDELDMSPVELVVDAEQAHMMKDPGMVASHSSIQFESFFKLVFH